MQLLDRFTRLDYDSLEDFLANYDYTVPENFNFAYDVMDEYARLAPNQRAMIWTNEAQEERIFTFGDFGRLSNQAANALKALGLQKGDVVILLLKRRWEYWAIALGLMKLGCILIPATAQLAKKDIVYRCEAASIKAVITVYLDEVCQHVEAQDLRRQVRGQGLVAEGADLGAAGVHAQQGVVAAEKYF